ncbi:hypothetical protein HPG69_015028 [Diceros bicornis minor]|uniref:ITPR-interacting domain-containing protein n=1 Tax=Diceros bicornis minor TaxID=77932 RepID=A0A7J7FK31_DICBM|nr:hypothetical protein HPG69_015028 [Diceros bicornis minor]
MEGSVLSPTSWEKRRAWLRQSRHWQTQILEEEAAAALQDVPDPEPSCLDDVFQEGNPVNKIEDWLQDCGYSEEGFFEEAGLSIYNGCPSHGTSFEDDLTLGAEATLLATNGKLFSRSFLETARPCQLPHLGCSLASSSMTGGTNKTSSSISEILDKVQEDAEDVLFSLGFGQEDHKDTSRIPARFFTTPSQAKGIDFQLFLKAQVRRIEMEDPCLMLASRFKQVQTLAATADAFFCLYSYVSKTPVQKFTPSHMFWNCNPTDVPSIRILAPEPEPHSPRERLRKAISKMCLYTCPRDRLSPPHNTPKRNSLDQVVWEVMDRVRGEKLVLQQDPEFGPGSQEDPVPPIRGTELPTSSCPCVLCPKEDGQQGMSTMQASSQTLDSNSEACCCTHSLPRVDLQWNTDSAQVKRELWSLQATNKEAHSAKDETFWKRKSRARKSLFKSTVRKRRAAGQANPDTPTSTRLSLAKTQEPQYPKLSQKCMMCFFLIPIAGFLCHHNSTCSDSSGFIEEPNSHLFLQEVVLPPTSSSCSLAPQTPELRKEMSGIQRPSSWPLQKIYSIFCWQKTIQIKIFLNLGIFKRE